MIKTPIDSYHIIPMNDLKDHQASPDCWCQPNMESIFEDNFPPYNIVHNSADGREKKPIFSC